MRKSEVQLSIIIPVYNTEIYLRDCLESILNQDLKNTEIIIVNDGSTDGSEQIIEKYLNSFNNIRYFSQKNQGQGAARNLAISNAKGEYLYFMDSDDKLDGNLFAKIFYELYKLKLDAVFFDGISFYDEKFELNLRNKIKLPSYNRIKSYGFYSSGEQLMLELLLDNSFFVSPCLYIVKRSIVIENKLKFLEGIKHEDEHFTTILMLFIEKCFHLNYNAFHRRIRKNSTMTNEKYNKRVFDLSVVLEKMDERFSKHRFVDSSTQKGFVKRMEQIYKSGVVSYIKTEKNKSTQVSFEKLNLIAKKYDHFNLKTKIFSVFTGSKIFYNLHPVLTKYFKNK